MNTIKLSRSHLKICVQLIQSGPRARAPLTEDRRLPTAQTIENHNEDTVCHQSSLNRHFSSPELFTKEYFQRMTLGRDLVERFVKAHSVGSSR